MPPGLSRLRFSSLCWTASRLHAALITTKFVTKLKARNVVVCLEISTLIGIFPKESRNCVTFRELYDIKNGFGVDDDDDCARTRGLFMKSFILLCWRLNNGGFVVIKRVSNIQGPAKRPCF